MEKWYPANLRLEGRVCTVVGGGTVAEHRVAGLLEVGAKVRVVAPEATAGLRRLAEDGAIELRQTRFAAPLLEGSFLVVCATDDASVNRAAAWVGKATGALVNMAAPPLELGDFAVPAVAHSGNLMVTVSTAGVSPELAHWLVAQLRGKVADVYAPWLERLEAIRAEARARVPNREERKRLWAAVMGDEVMALVRDGRYDEAEGMAHDAVANFRA